MNQENKTKNFSWFDVPKTIWYFLEEDKKRFVLFFFIVLAIFFYELVPVYIVGKIVDFFTHYSPGQSLSLFYFYVIFVGVTWMLASLIRLKGKNVLSIIGLHLRSRARVWGFARLTEFSLEWHNKENTGSKLQRIFSGAEALNRWSKLIRHDLLKFVANIIGVLSFFLFTDYKIFLLVLIYSALFLYIEFTFGKKIFQLSNRFNELNQKAGGTYMENANNMLSIKALGREEGMAESVLDRETMARDISIDRTNTSMSKWRLFQIMNAITLAIFLFLIGQALLSNIITLGSVVVLFTYFNSRLQGSLGDLSEIYTEMIELRSDVGQMMPIFRETEFIKTGNEKFPKDWKTIELKNAVMDYGSGQMGLKDFNLTLKRNTKTGVAGLSGSGKSTLAKIILGLYSLKGGIFKVGDKNYYSISHNETLSNLTVVLQETELFNLSLRDNITMMRGEDIGLLNMAIDISQLGEVIGRLPEGIDSRIGEKGYMLSGGERQRLGIARAIYKNAPIIILDEATSSLDSETEGKIMERLLGEYGKDKTFLIIAHRLGTLKYADNIAVMERGQVVEEGSYDTLMNDKSSVFYRMNQEKNSDGK